MSAPTFLALPPAPPPACRTDNDGYLDLVKKSGLPACSATPRGGPGSG